MIGNRIVQVRHSRQNQGTNPIAGRDLPMAANRGIVGLVQIIFRAIAGNVIGVVEKPDAIDPTKSLREQYMVKIGVLDREGPMPKQNIYTVIRKLKRFVETRIS
jgi:hypothetical protein